MPVIYVTVLTILIDKGGYSAVVFGQRLKLFFHMSHTYLLFFFVPRVDVWAPTAKTVKVKPIY